MSILEHMAKGSWTGSPEDVAVSRADRVAIVLVLVL